MEEGNIMRIVDAVRIATAQQAKGEPAQWYRYLPFMDVRKVGFNVDRCREERTFEDFRKWRECYDVADVPCVVKYVQDVEALV